MHTTTPLLKIRRATGDDAAVIAHHRVRMFEDMRIISEDAIPELFSLSEIDFRRTVSTGEYIGWLAYDETSPGSIVAGAGLLIRTIPPFPVIEGSNAGAIRLGKQGLVINVYAEPAWRRKGLARMLMREVMAFAGEAGVEGLVLHASAEGRPLYEQLGFRATNEMRLVQT